MGKTKNTDSQGASIRAEKPQTAPFEGVQPMLELPKHKSGTRALHLEEHLQQEIVLGEITRRLADYDAQKEEHDRWIRHTLSSLDARSINNLRYRLFAPHYDQHMSYHERAIDFLLRQFIEMETAAFPKMLVKGNILEMSCGSGTVIKLLCNSLGPERAALARFIANDISEDMKALAMKKLSSIPAEVQFTSEDISMLPFKRQSFDAIILSQTLHLITDEEVVAQERASNYMHIDSERHLEAKSHVIGEAWDALAYGGTFIIIDEWPALLSDRGGPLGAGFAYLFNDGLRPVDIEIFQSSIMHQLPGSRFVAQLKVPIDAKHHMHLLAYTKEERKPLSKMPVSPDFSEHRERASASLISSFKAIDPAFIESLQPLDGSTPWVDLHPIPEDLLLVRRSSELDEDLLTRRCIVLDRCMHDLQVFDRFELVSNAVRSLSVGGSLIIVDEWNPPEGTRYPLRLNSLSSSLMIKFKKNMVFAGSVRVPIHDLYSAGMYGFEYRKVI